VLATVGEHELDTSPRGDAPGFVTMADEKTLLLPDRRGNQRIDSLRNIARDPRVALLFLVPGCGEALRVNGTARISASPALCARFAVQGADALLRRLAPQTRRRQRPIHRRSANSCARSRATSSSRSATSAASSGTAP
jgi:predicted pyridoxine 5'-phosphate oxidase superfamily flavin-nucleotide-binding protein